MLKALRRAAPVLVLVLAAWWGAAVQAQTLTDPDARLELAGEYIGVHGMMAIAVKHCNFTTEREYDHVLGASIVRSYLRPDEQGEIDAYMASESLPNDLAYLQGKFDESMQLLRDSSLDEAAACAELLKIIRAQFNDTESQLKDLR